MQRLHQTHKPRLSNNNMNITQGLKDTKLHLLTAGCFRCRGEETGVRAALQSAEANVFWMGSGGRFPALIWLQISSTPARGSSLKVPRLH